MRYRSSGRCLTSTLGWMVTGVGERKLVQNILSCLNTQKALNCCLPFILVSLRSKIIQTSVMSPYWSLGNLNERETRWCHLSTLNTLIAPCDSAWPNYFTWAAETFMFCPCPSPQPHLLSDSPTLERLSVGTIDSSDWIILWGCPRIPRSIPGLYPVDSSRSQLWQLKISPACLMSLGLGEIPLVENYRSRPFFSRYLFLQMYHASSHYRTSEITTSFLWNNLPLPTPVPNY